MIPTLILAIVCIILIFILYLVTGGWRKYGGFSGIYKWMYAGMRIQDGASKTSGGTFRETRRTQSVASRGADDSEVVGILRDLYLEFDERQRALEARIDELERILRERRHVSPPEGADTRVATVATDASQRRAHFEQGVNVRDSVDRAPRQVSSDADAHRYFAIFDMLNGGFSDAEISEKLGVALSEVSYVRAIMQGPHVGEKRRGVDE